VPAAFLQLAGAVIRHRSDERFALLYQLLWRLGRQGDLLSQYADPDVRKAHAFAQSVAQAEQQDAGLHRLQALRGRRGPRGAGRLVRARAPGDRDRRHFFAQRFARRRFSLLTPDVCAHWDGGELTFAPGADPADAPREAGLEEFWRNLPAAASIPSPVIRPTSPQGEPVVPPMARQTHTTSSGRLVRAAQRAERDASYDGLAVATLEEVMWACRCAAAAASIAMRRKACRARDPAGRG